jgi:hypothetical protein
MASRKYTILFLIFLVSFANAQPDPYNYWNSMLVNGIKKIQGFNFQCEFNSNGLIGGYTLGLPTTDTTNPYTTIWPMGYAEEYIRQYIYAAGPWVGAVTHRDYKVDYKVTTSFVEHFDPPRFICETLCDYARGDSAWQTSILNTNEPNRRGFDDDGDGCIDCDELDGLDNNGNWLAIRDDLSHNGKPDHGEPNVDEDYGAVSESDFYMTFRDSFAEPRIPEHSPLDLRYLLKSYAWKDRVREPILPFEYYIINHSHIDLDSVYLGFFVHQQIAFTVPDPQLKPNSYHPPEQVSYASSIRTVVGETVRSRYAAYGLTFLGCSKPLQDMKITYKAYDNTWGPPYVPNTDEGKYREMSSGTTDGLLFQNHPAYLLAVGPFGTMHPGDTLRLSLAFIAGSSFSAGNNNITDNAAKAISLYERNFYPPSVPPSPPLRITPGDSRVTLDWSWYPGYKSSNPFEIWDDGNKFVSTLPDTHWRRINPPAGKTSGGRVFEGFRVWRSDYPVFDERQFSLLKQFDVKDDLGFEGQTGIQFTFNDSMVVRGKHYWYAVTSLSIPDYILTYEKDSSGNTTSIDTVITDPFESPIHENVLQYQVPFQTSSKVGEVKVVPNPYRTDRDYTYAGGGYEGLGRRWDETKRLVWFIHLPPKCTIRIFSLVGEIIKTIDHDDAWRTADGKPIGQEEFYLLSESNRALASGVFVYTVESDLGKQIGKFVVIR